MRLVSNHNPYLLADTRDDTPDMFPEFLQRVSSSSTLSAFAARLTPVTYKPARKPYKPMSVLELLEWEFMALRPSSVAPDRPIISLPYHYQQPQPDTCLDFTDLAPALDFTESDHHAYA